MTTLNLTARPARRRSRPLLLTAAALIVGAFALIPLGFVLWASLTTGWSVAAPMIFRPRVAGLLLNTVLLVVLTVPICVVLAAALAWLTERTDLPFARLWSWLAVAPLAVPAFVHSYAWVSLWPGIHGLGAGVLIAVLAYFPFVYLPIAATLRRLDPALEDQAASLGLTLAQSLRRVTLPQLRLAICGGALLVGLHLLAEYGLFSMIRFDTFTTAIFEQFQSTYNGAAAQMLALVLVLSCLCLLGLEAMLRGDSRYARVGMGAPRPALRHKLGRSAALWLVLPLATAVLSLGVPCWTLGRWLLAGGAEIWRMDQIGSALWQTLLLCLIGGVTTVLAALPMAWLSVRAPSSSHRLIEASYYLASAIPGVVVALALVTVTVRAALPLYQTTATITLAYMILFLPRALITLRASLAQAPVELEDAAASLGQSPLTTFRRVTLRLAAPGAAAGMALTSLGIMNELTATQMLAPLGTRTLTMAFWSLTGEIDYAAAAPYAVLMVLFSLPMTVLLHRQSQRSAGR
jgi:iron(III) transport system permease protein